MRKQKSNRLQLSKQTLFSFKASSGTARKVTTDPTSTSATTTILTSGMHMPPKGN